MTRSRMFRMAALSPFLGLVLGCAGEPASNSESTAAESGGDSPVVASASSNDLHEAADPAPNSPEWALLEIRKLRAQSLPNTTDVAQLSASRRDRNEKIVNLATAAIAATHDDPTKEGVFTDAVHQLMEARLQLALQGSREDIDALYEDAASLQKRSPGSKAASEAAFARARFAHMNAQRFSKQEPRWLEEFARQARLYSQDFPEEEMRAPMLLHAAGWSCELHKMGDEAVACYTALAAQYPNHQQAAQSTAAVRRLQLRGKPLDLAGPTRDGGFVKVDELVGKVVLVSFWASDSARFLEIVPRIETVASKYGKHGLAVIGVNLDEDEAELDAFLAEHPMPWPHIFPPDPAERRWNCPIVRHYGVRDIPALWLVDAKGLVVDTFVEPDQLEDRVRALLLQARQEK